MDKTFNISVRDRLAKNLSHLDYVCGNTGYMVRFDFDEEWDAYPIKTARFIESSGEHHDVAVIDSQCEFPQIMNTIRVEVGVYAGDLYTTTPAVIGARRSILSTGGDRPAVPEKEHYDQMMEAINKNALRAENAADDAEESAQKAEEALANMKERYYIPNVSEKGELNWEPNAEDMPAVPAANIKGPKGDGGVSPTVDVEAIDGGHRLTITDASGSKTVDVMDGEKGEPGDNDGNDELFIVRFSLVDGAWQADHTYKEIDAAKQEGKTLLAVGAGRVYSYSGVFAGTGHLFTSHYYESGVGIVENLAKVASDNTAMLGTYKPTTTPNPKKLTIVKGDEEIGYDGSKAVTVEIPEGGDGNGTGLPTGGAPHQMLVTDAEGKAKWEPKKQITGEADSGKITFSMPYADMIALGQSLREYDITIIDNNQRYKVFDVFAGSTSVRLLCLGVSTGAPDRIKTVPVNVTNTGAIIDYLTVRYGSLYDLPDPTGEWDKYLGTDDSGNYVLKEAPTGSASAPMLQMIDVDGVLAFIDMETEQTMVVTLEMLVSLYEDSIMNLKLLVMNANTGTDISVFSFGYINTSEDPENPPYILFSGEMGKTIRMDYDGTLRYIEDGGSGGVPFETDETLSLENGILSVNTADVVEQDNTLPITSAAVYTEVGNINALLHSI